MQTAQTKKSLILILVQKIKIFRKVYFDVCDLKLEILMCFDKILRHLYGVTFKNKQQYTANNLMQYALSYHNAF